MNVEGEAIKAYNKTVDFFKYGDVDCEDYKDGCQKYTIYKSFVRENDRQKIKDFLEK